VILLACATEPEFGPWMHRPNVEPLVTGVGPVEAACAIARSLALRRYELVISAGIAGALDRAARIGEGVVVADERYELTLENGQPIVLPDGRQVAGKASSEPGLVGRLRDQGFAALHGVTVSRVTSTEETAERLARQGAQVESMEGFAVLRAAERAGVPAIELRGISNRVGRRDRSGWDFGAGVAGLSLVMHTFFELTGTAGGVPT